MTVVLDASALLAWLQGAPGSDAVGAHLSNSAPSPSGSRRSP
jgi:PIN domain nuclease of toxin-antitoxin system